MTVKEYVDLRFPIGTLLVLGERKCTYIFHRSNHNTLGWFQESKDGLTHHGTNIRIDDNIDIYIDLLYPEIRNDIRNVKIDKFLY